MNTNKSKINMTGDKLLPSFIYFAIPILISAACQRLFNAADSVIVGRYAGPLALAAVGGTGPVVSLFTWGLMGFSVGADVTVSRLYGKKDAEGVKEAIHTAYCIAISAGLTVSVIAFVCARMILGSMDVPSEVLDLSVLYLRIYAVGLFFSVIYNFGAACLRSSGDSKRPTRYMIFAGVLNVILNLIFVLQFQMGVAGVAIATSFSHFTTASLTTRALLKEKGFMQLKPDLLITRFRKHHALQIVSIGLPSMLQNALFCISNIVVQSSINSFGSMTMAANSAATTLEEFVYVVTAATNQTNITFTGQNVGAKKYKNIPKVLLIAVSLISIFGFAIGLADNLFAVPLLGLFTKDLEVIRIGITRLRIVALPLFLNGVMDSFAGSLRAMGSSVLPMVTSLAGICGFRLLFVFTIFRQLPTLEVLYLCYPLSWAITIAIMSIFWFRKYRSVRDPFLV